MNNPYKEALMELETGLWEHDNRVDEGIAKPYEYDSETFRACLKIFMSAALWKLWEYTENKTLSEKASFAESLGTDIRGIILRYTGIDSHELYKQGVKE